MKRVLLIYYIFTYYTVFTIEIGITLLHFENKFVDKCFNLKIEEQVLSIISDIPNSNVKIIFNKKRILEVKKEIEKFKQELSEQEKERFIEENIDYCFFFEIYNFDIKEKKDFYDPRKTFFQLESEIKILIINNKSGDIIEKFFFIFSQDKSLENIKLKFLENLRIKLKTFIDNLSIFKKKVTVEKINYFFVKLNIGKRETKPQDLYCSILNGKESVIKIIKSYEDYSIGYTVYGLPFQKGEDFVKQDNINMEIYFFSGFSFSDKENKVATVNNYFSFLPYIGLRFAIPIGIVFFRPIINFEMNFLYTDNRLYTPFSFETGCQGEFFLRRLGFDFGLLIGGFFAPDKENNYKADSFIIRPYLHLSTILTKYIEIFGETGYRFLLEGEFYKLFNINLSGIYFLFGISLNL